MKHAWVTDGFYFSSGKSLNYYTNPIVTLENAVHLRLASFLHTPCALYKTNHIRELMRTLPFGPSSHNLWLYNLQSSLLYFSLNLEWFLEHYIKVLEFSVTFLIYHRRFVSVQKKKSLPW